MKDKQDLQNDEKYKNAIIVTIRFREKHAEDCFLCGGYDLDHENKILSITDWKGNKNFKLYNFDEIKSVTQVKYITNSEFVKNESERNIKSLIYKASHEICDRIEGNKILPYEVEDIIKKWLKDYGKEIY